MTGVTAQATLFDPVEGRRRRDLGMARARSASDPFWRRQFIGAVKVLASSGREFTADDVIALVGLPPGNPNAIGATMNGLARQGVIVNTGRTRKAARAPSHARRQMVWIGAA